jgi:hypothetical protein
MDDNVKVPVTNKPAKLPRTHGSSKCVICLEAKSSVQFPPIGSFINEQSVTMPNLLYNLINLVLTEDQLDRPISDLEDEMSEATNMRVVSFAQDLIYDVTRCKVQTPEHVGLAVLLKNLTGSAELVKVRQTLCRVGDSSNIMCSR